MLFRSQSINYTLNWSDNYNTYVLASGTGASSGNYYQQCNIEDSDGLNAQPPILCPPKFSTPDSESGYWSVTVTSYQAVVSTQPCGGLCSNTYPTGATCQVASTKLFNSVHTCGVKDCGTGCNNNSDNCPGGLVCVPTACTGSCQCSNECDDQACCVAPACDWATDCAANACT